MINLKGLIKYENTHHQALATGHVMPDPTRCMQCGMCSYNCPIGIDVRRHAWEGKAIKDSRCLTCGECVARCPRGALSFVRTRFFEDNFTIE
jgi:ferredoxin